MKIGIEVQPLTRQHYTGVDFYILNIVQQLVALSPDDNFDLCYFGSDQTKLPVTGPNVMRRPIKLARRIYQILFRYLIAPPYDWLAGSHTDLFLFPDFVTLPLRFTRKQIVIVYDLAFLEAPETLTPRLRRYLTKFVPRSIERATAVVTISESTKRQICDHYGTDPAKVRVITPAVDLVQFQPGRKDDSLSEKYGIKGDYILFLGTIEPRKNIEGLIKAYLALDPELRAKYQLVLAGGKGWQDDKILSLIEQAGDRVVQTGYIDETDKADLYRGAAVFVYPSIYEGWGMQPLEAMACGTPVIVSDNTSLPEVVGEAGLKVDAKDYQSITQAIEKVLTDESLAGELSQKGLVQAKRFSWVNSAKLLKQLIEAVAKS